MKLTKNFDIKEFVCHDGSVPNAEQTQNIKELCENVLQPLREAYGAIEIMSGYRSPAYNKQVGGALNSKHTTGEAADIKCDKLDEAFAWIIRKCSYDQVILERKDDGSKWIHVSYRKEANRTQSMYCMIEKGKAVYRRV